MERSIAQNNVTAMSLTTILYLTTRGRICYIYSLKFSLCYIVIMFIIYLLNNYIYCFIFIKSCDVMARNY